MDTHIITRAEDLIKSSVVCDAALPWTQYGSLELRNRTLPRYQSSGFSFVSLTLSSDKEGPRELLHALGRVRKEIAENKYAKLIGSASDIRAAHEEGKLAISLNVQGTNNLGGDINLVDVYYRLGIRQMILVYNNKNMVGDGCHERTDSGLSNFGIDLVQEMNRVGMMVDCSHTGYRTTMDAMEVSTKPVVFSHSNPKALWQHDRNIRDDQAIACAKTGGFIGAVGVGIFMGNNDASTENYFRQIDYFCQLVGAMHVGLGTDYVYDHEEMQRYMKTVKSPESGQYEKMSNFFQPEQLSELANLMVKSGYSDADIRGIFGENYLRVADQVWN